jgi:threonine/homoserine efflux transporter RhtA
MLWIVIVAICGPAFVGGVALLPALLPATATVIAALVLAQIPTLRDLFGVALVMPGVAVHRPAD